MSLAWHGMECQIWRESLKNFPENLENGAETAEMLHFCNKSLKNGAGRFGDLDERRRVPRETSLYVTPRQRPARLA
jgi:hypothetical protein